MTITFLDEREPVDDGNGEAKAPRARGIPLYDGGLVDYVRVPERRTRRPLHEEPIYLAGQREDVILAEVAIQYTDSYTENVFSYVNNIPTGEGGTHETGFKAALHQGDERICAQAVAAAVKDKDANLRAARTYREGHDRRDAVRQDEETCSSRARPRRSLGNTGGARRRWRRS